MIKVIALIRKKPGLTTEEFRSYYEQHHAPLAKRLLLGGADYRRNYPNVIRIDGKEAAGEPEFDVIMEAWFEDQAQYDAFSRNAQEPATRAAIIEDELNFMDRSSTRIMVVEEHR